MESKKPYNGGNMKKGVRRESAYSGVLRLRPRKLAFHKKSAPGTTPFGRGGGASF
jgi:hypothetical protein